MMKMNCMMRRLAAMILLTLVPACAGAQSYDGASAKSWLEQFALALAALTPINDAAQTGDPARAGQYLMEYPFGTVLSGVPEAPGAQDILGIDVRTGQVTDCRGVRVGMGLQDALGGMSMSVSAGEEALLVLGTQDDYCWSWAYAGEDGIYGVEYIAYQESGSGMTEYTLTYVLEGDRISAIRMRIAPATQAQAREGLDTAREMERRQNEERIARRNDAAMFTADQAQVQGGKALGMPVASLIARMGEPQSIQTLPQAKGRILLYDGAVVRLAFNEATGEELVRGVSVSKAAYAGPNGLKVGMSAQEATALFACEKDVSLRGGTLYLAGEAAGEAPYGEAVATGTSLLLRYACLTDAGETVLLEAGIDGGRVAYWMLSYEADVLYGM